MQVSMPQQVKVNLTWQDSAMTWPDTTALAADSTALAVDTLPLPLPVIPTPSLFEGHALQPADAALPVHEAPEGMGWVFVILMLCFVLYGIAQRRSDGRPANVLQAAFDRGMANQLMRYELGPSSLSLWVMLAAGLLSLSLFLNTVWARVSGADALSFTDNAIIFGGLVGLGIGIRVVYWFVGTLCKVQTLASTHSFDRMVMVISSGLVMLPLNVLHVYGPVWLDTATLLLGGTVVGLFYLKDLQRGMALLSNVPSVNVAHIFYYICAFKILPLSVIIRLALAF